MNIKGKIVTIMEVQQITASFRKREFVVEYVENPQYPEVIKFELIQDRCGLIDGYAVGQEVEVHFNLKGRKWTDSNGIDKYFNTLQAWKIVELQPDNQSPATGSNAEEAPPTWLNSNEEDIPF